MSSIKILGPAPRPRPAPGAAPGWLVPGAILLALAALLGFAAGSPPETGVGGARPAAPQVLDWHGNSAGSGARP